MLTIANTCTKVRATEIIKIAKGKLELQADPFPVSQLCGNFQKHRLAELNGLFALRHLEDKPKK